MVCYHPLDAVLPLQPDETGKTHLIFSPRKIAQLRRHSLIQTFDNFIDMPDYWDYPLYVDKTDVTHINMKIPCGKCLGCKLDYARRWTVRSTHEAYMNDYYRNNCFLTLTFNNYSLGQRKNPLSVDKLELSQWIKRLRERVRVEYGKTFRFLACGEYGALRKRPHYHVLVFGFNFPDKQIINNIKDLRPRKLSNGQMVYYYRSKFLEDNWKPCGASKGYGFSVIGDVSFETCAYVSRYILKKNTEEYNKGQAKEFLLTSRMPGLGYSYLEKYYKTIFNTGLIDFGDGRISDIPRYYVNKLETLDPNMYKCYKIDKRNEMIDNLMVENIDMTTERLLAREELKKYHLDKLHRQYEFNPILHNI